MPGGASVAGASVAEGGCRASLRPMCLRARVGVRRASPDGSGSSLERDLRREEAGREVGGFN